MTIDTTTPRSRRALLAAALGGGLTSILAALGRPRLASAANGDTVTVGNSFNGTAPTTIQNSNGDAIIGRNTATSQSGVYGHSNAGSGTTYGVFGRSDSPDGSGVGAYNPYGGGNPKGVSGAAPYGIGVHGEGLTGVWGASDTGTGVRGEVTGSFATAVAGTANAGRAVGGWTLTGTALWGQATTGKALDVTGKTYFNRSGRTNVPAGKSYVDITPAGGLGGSPNILATLQTRRSGVWVMAVRRNYPSSGKARIYLNKVASNTSSTAVAWFVLD